MSRSRRWARAAPALAALGLAACTVGPNYRPPHLDTAARFGAEPTDVASRTFGGEIDPRWWDRFHDAELSSLIDRLARQNLQLRQAEDRIVEARAQTRITAAQGLPNLDAGASYTRTRVSPNGTVSLIEPAPGAPLEYNDDKAQTTASWEIDLFGRVRRAVEAARANTTAVEAARRALALDAAAELASDYLGLRADQASEAVLRRNIETSRTRSRLVRDRFRNGVATTLDVAQADAFVAAIQQDLPDVLADEAARANAIALLLAEPPRALDAELAAVRPLPVPPPVVAVGLPADLIRRRPDVAEAAARLHIAVAEQGVARADFYPDVRFDGSFGLESLHSNSLFDLASRTFRLTPSLDLPIFEGGRLRGQLRLRDAQAREAALAFDQSALQAWHEVDNALTAYARAQQNAADVRATLDADRRALSAADQQFAQGAVDYLNVVQQQSALLSAQASLVRADARVDDQLVSLFKALGGAALPTAPAH